MNDAFFQKAVQPYSWFAALFLFLSYIIGLWFTLRTHAALIWAAELEEKKTGNAPHPPASYEPRHFLFPHGQHIGNGANNYNSNDPKNSVRESQLYRRILGQSLNQFGLTDSRAGNAWERAGTDSGVDSTVPHVVPPPSGDNDDGTPVESRPREERDEGLVRHVTEVAATVAAVAAREGSNRKLSNQQPTAPHLGNNINNNNNSKPPTTPKANAGPEENDEAGFSTNPTGGHDAPNWSRTKSSVILLAATVLYAVIAEILVNTVDVVLENVDIDEKFLGITLFALVPNTTEFLV